MSSENGNRVAYDRMSDVIRELLLRKTEIDIKIKQLRERILELSDRKSDLADAVEKDSVGQGAGFVKEVARLSGEIDEVNDEIVRLAQEKTTLEIKEQELERLAKQSMLIPPSTEHN